MTNICYFPSDVFFVIHSQKLSKNTFLTKVLRSGVLNSSISTGEACGCATYIQRQNENLYICSKK